jgi:hypothetical protein
MEEDEIASQIWPDEQYAGWKVVGEFNTLPTEMLSNSPTPVLLAKSNVTSHQTYSHEETYDIELDEEQTVDTAPVNDCGPEVEARCDVMRTDGDATNMQYGNAVLRTDGDDTNLQYGNAVLRTDGDDTNLQYGNAVLRTDGDATNLQYGNLAEHQVEGELSTVGKMVDMSKDIDVPVGVSKEYVLNETRKVETVCINLLQYCKKLQSSLQGENPELQNVIETSKGSDAPPLPFADVTNAVNKGKKKCKYCDKHYVKNSSMYEHVKAVHQRIMFECDECQKTFTTSSGLKNHKSSHKDEGSFLCTDCGSVFVFKSQMERHSLVHSGEKKFHCTSCTKAFKLEGDLKRHLLSCGKVKITCKTCGKLFTNSKLLREHTRVTHSEQPMFACLQCECVPFKYRNALRRHQKKNHSTDST